MSLSASGTVSATDLKDSWDYFDSGSYVTRNTESHGRYRFVIENEVWYHDSRGTYTSRWDTVVKRTVEPDDTDSGSFDAVIGEDILGRPFRNHVFKIHVKWITTIYVAHYDFDIT